MLPFVRIHWHQACLCVFSDKQLSGVLHLRLGQEPLCSRRLLLWKGQNNNHLHKFVFFCLFFYLYFVFVFYVILCFSLLTHPMCARVGGCECAAPTAAGAKRVELFVLLRRGSELLCARHSARGHGKRRACSRWANQYVICFCFVLFFDFFCLFFACYPLFSSWFEVAILLIRFFNFCVYSIQETKEDSARKEAIKDWQDARYMVYAFSLSHILA